MTSRVHYASIAVAVLVLLAGCSVPFTGTDEPTTPTPDPDADLNYPYGWDADGISTDVTREDNPLLRESSVTVQFERQISLADSEDDDFEVQSRTVQTHRVSGAQERWQIDVQRRDVVSEYYYEDSKEYSRTAVLYDNDSVQSETFDVSSRDFDKPNAYQIYGAEMLALGTTYEDASIETRNGTEVVVYKATGVDTVASNSPVYEIGQNANVTQYSSTLIVNADTGHIKSISVNVEGSRGDELFKASFYFEYSNIGDTTVTEPDWVSQVENDSIRETPSEFNNTTVS